MVQFAISSNKLVLVNGRSNVPTGVEGKLIAEFSRLSVDKIFFSLSYQFWNVYFIMCLHSLSVLMLICLLYKVIIIIKAFHVVFCQNVELECLLFQLIFIF